MAAVADSTPTKNCFPTKTSNPTAETCRNNSEINTYLNTRATYVIAAGYTVNRVTGGVTLT